MRGPVTDNTDVATALTYELHAHKPPSPIREGQGDCCEKRRQTKLYAPAEAHDATNDTLPVTGA